ncbi:MAG: hypothetical protein IKR52_03240, partial [Paludibacteraceae bacterium]|nr:hypothetical protein [Paludibacteraceae bacterium]
DYKSATLPTELYRHDVKELFFGLFAALSLPKRCAKIDSFLELAMRSQQFFFIFFRLSIFYVINQIFTFIRFFKFLPPQMENPSKRREPAAV